MSCAKSVIQLKGHDLRSTIITTGHRNQGTKAAGLGRVFPVSLPSLGTMFLTMNASQEPGVKTSFQGWRMSLAEESLGCHFCRALDSLLRMGEYSGSRRACMRGSHGWIQEWMGTVSVSGFQFSTCRGSAGEAAVHAACEAVS